MNLDEPPDPGPNINPSLTVRLNGDDTIFFRTTQISIAEAYTLLTNYEKTRKAEKAKTVKETGKTKNSSKSQKDQTTPVRTQLKTLVQRLFSSPINPDQTQTITPKEYILLKSEYQKAWDRRDTNGPKITGKSYYSLHPHSTPHRNGHNNKTHNSLPPHYISH